MGSVGKLRLLVTAIAFLCLCVAASSRLAEARELPVNRAYTAGGNLDYPLPDLSRRPIVADFELQVSSPTSQAIQAELNAARDLAVENPGSIVVVTLDPTATYSLTAPLSVYGHTVLEGAGAKLMVATNDGEKLSHVVTMRGVRSGIHSCEIVSNDLVTTATLIVAANASETSILDNLVDGGIQSNQGPPLLDVNSSVTNLQVDGNWFRNGTNAIRLGQASIVETRICCNRFSDWYDRAIFVVNRSHTLPSLDIDIVCNRIEPPHVNGIVRQPIAFQSLSPGGPQVMAVQIRQNKISGNGLPYVVGPASRFSEGDRIEEIAATGKFRLLNGATADMISLHDVFDFEVFANYIEQGGEIGINLSRGTGFGSVCGNYISEQDTSGVNIGADLGDNFDGENPLRPVGIEVFDNTIVDPARDRALEVDRSTTWWARSGITVQAADFVVLRDNFVDERSIASESLVDFGVYSRGNTHDLVVEASTFVFSCDDVTWTPNDFALDILEFAVPGDATRDGVVDLDDVELMLDHWYAEGDWGDGDFNGDGFVDLTDFDLLIASVVKRRDRRIAKRRKRRAERARLRNAG